MADDPTFVATPKLGLGKIVPSDTTSFVTLVTGSPLGTKVTGIGAVGEDTSAREVQLVILRSAIRYTLTTAELDIDAGLDPAIPPVNLLEHIDWLPQDNDGQSYLFLESGDVLQVRSLSTVTADKELCFVATFGNF